jgi:hypothetical protein
MEAQAEDPAEENRRLRRCVSDLVSILAVPATWIGGEPTQIVSTLLDALMGMLSLDFVYVRLNSPLGGMLFETMRSSQSLDLTDHPKEISDQLDRLLGDNSRNWPPFLKARIGGANISMVILEIGLQGEIGTIVTGSKRSDFPGQTERLVLSVAANQAAIGLQEARLLIGGSQNEPWSLPKPTKSYNSRLGYYSIFLYLPGRSGLMGHRIS